MKNVTEWAQAFNLLYNNIASDKAPGLEPYEISRLLTDAQDTVVTGLYSGVFGSAFEATEDVTAALESLVRQCSGIRVDDNSLVNRYKVSDDSVLFKLEPEDDIMFRTLELCDIENGCGSVERVAVVPVTQDEFWRTIRNPFKKQNGRRVLRLSFADAKNGAETYSVVKYSELVSDYPISSYLVRYISRPKPIILEELPEGLLINGERDAQTCLLPEPLHQTILNEAVRMAKAIWTA